MKSAFLKFILTATALAATLAGQAAPPAPAQAPPQAKGLPPDWDIRQVLEDLAAHAKRLQPILNQIDPENWVTSKGAPEEYVTQWKSSKEQAQAIVTTMPSLISDPERLSPELETYFRVQALQSMITSLADGIRKYQNPALADLLSGIAAEGGANREQYQQYIVQLAAQKEQMLKIMDHEAQRCRGQLTRQPAPVRK